MTQTHYASKDKIVEVLVTNDDNRWPRHTAPMTMIKLRPQPHSRCRNQWGGVTLMLTFAELRAIAEAVASCDPDFRFTMSKSAQNKPDSRKEHYQKLNIERVRRIRECERAQPRPKK